MARLLGDRAPRPSTGVRTHCPGYRRRSPCTTEALLRPAHTMPHFSLCAIVFPFRCPAALSRSTMPAHLLWLKRQFITIALEFSISKSATSRHRARVHDSMCGLLVPVTCRREGVPDGEDVEIGQISTALAAASPIRPHESSAP